MANFSRKLKQTFMSTLRKPTVAENIYRVARTFKKIENISQIDPLRNLPNQQQGQQVDFFRWNTEKHILTKFVDRILGMCRGPAAILFLFVSYDPSRGGAIHKNYFLGRWQTTANRWSRTLFTRCRSDVKTALRSHKTLLCSRSSGSNLCENVASTEAF